MRELLTNLGAPLVRTFRVADAVDIAVVACLVYFALTWLGRRGSKSAIVLLATVLVLYELAHWLQMYVTLALFEVGVTVLILGFLIVYQEEVRGAIERLISRRGKKGIVLAREADTLISDLCEAVEILAESRTGALIVLQGHEVVDRHVQGGIHLDGRVSVPLILSLFNPASPAHDGAIIIEGDRFERFAAHLPLSTNFQELQDRGTRHTAAVGLSELCDALVLIVSEERGTISCAESGRLRELDSAAECAQVFEQFLDDRHPPQHHSQLSLYSLRGWSNAFASVAIAVILWGTISTPNTESIQQTFDVPVAIADVPAGWSVSQPDTPKVEITLIGPSHAFASLDAAKLRQLVPLPPPTEGWHYLFVDSDKLEGLPEGLTPVEIVPQRVRVIMQRKSADTPSPSQNQQ